MSSIRLSVNARVVHYEGDGAMPLLWYLRDELGLTGSKYGCGVGVCGACTVHVEGQTQRACLTPMSTLAEKKVVTIEAIASAGLEKHPVLRAWREENVPQCGYCQAGQVMSAIALLSTTAQPSDTQIDAAMSGNLCRCGTYERIRKAVHRAVQLKKAGA
jgi:isoquinoline 1-oxidoreductase subunit alpha